jgi:hypothetical protein
VSNPIGTFNLRDGTVEILPTEHFDTEDEARRVVEPFLRAWEIAADLAQNPGTLRFKFVSAEVIDRDPAPAGAPQTAEAKALKLMLTLGQPTVHITCRKYPQPPIDFRSTVEVEQAYQRWLNFRRSKEPLQSMAYFVLTLLETRAGGKRKAARVFNIDHSVLSKVGHLCSEKGDPITARKAPPRLAFQELTGGESSWLEQAVRRLIWRLGEHASGASVGRVKMADLPPL